MDDKIESQTPKEEEKVVEQKTVKTTKSLHPALIVLIVLFVLLLLLPLLGILLFRFNNKSTEGVKMAICKTTETVEPQECEVCDKTECPIQDTRLTNRNWVLISAPALKLSMEVPSGEPVSHMFQNTELQSKWEVTYLMKNEYVPEGLGAYLGEINAEFLPLPSESDVACGGSGCANISSVGVEVYNNGNKTLSQVYESYRNAVDGEASTIDGKAGTKWNLPVYEFEVSYLDGHEYGYLLIKNGLTYRVSYDITPQPAQVASDAKKILESIRFN